MANEHGHAVAFFLPQIAFATFDPFTDERHLQSQPVYLCRDQEENGAGEKERPGQCRQGDQNERVDLPLFHNRNSHSAPQPFGSGRIGGCSEESRDAGAPALMMQVYLVDLYLVDLHLVEMPRRLNGTPSCSQATGRRAESFLDDPPSAMRDADEDQCFNSIVVPCSVGMFGQGFQLIHGHLRDRMDVAILIAHEIELAGKKRDPLRANA